MLQTKGLFQKIFANEKIASFIGLLDRFFIKLPHLPKKIRLLISKIIPFLVLLFGIIGLVVSLVSGLFLILAIFSLDWASFFQLLYSFSLVLLDTLLLLKAFKPLRQGNAVGWIYLFWAEILEVVNFVMRVINNDANIWLGTLIITLVFYLLFEIGQFYVYKKNINNTDSIAKI